MTEKVEGPTEQKVKATNEVEERGGAQAEEQHDVDDYDEEKIGEGTGMDLTDLDEAFEQAPEGDVPEGEYEVAVAQRPELRISRSGNRMLEWKLRVEAPKYRGETIWHCHMLQTPENMKYLKKALVKIGVKIAKLSDLPKCLPELDGMRILVRVKYRDEYQNVYFLKWLDGPSMNGSEDEEDLTF